MTTDKQLLKKRFAATFRQYDSLAVVQQEICGQLDEMIGRICPGRIGRAMEVGCGTGFLTRYLLRRYPDAEWIVNDTNTAESMASGQLPVFATPALVALMEKAARRLFCSVFLRMANAAASTRRNSASSCG